MCVPEGESIMTNNNNKEVCVCGWCGRDITDGMEFCNDECRDYCVESYEKDMVLQQEVYDAERTDLINNHDVEDCTSSNTDMDTCAECGCDIDTPVRTLHVNLCSYACADKYTSRW